MELSWSTFVLEVVNFLVLVWILQHFLYKPVLGIIAKRRSEVEKTLSDAKTQQEEAEALQRQYEGRLADWERERQQARSSLADEIEAERARRLSELRAGLEAEREKARAADERKLADLRDRVEQKALELGSRFAARLLGHSATPDLEASLIELLLEELETWPGEKRSAFEAAAGDSNSRLVVTSAFPLPDRQRTRLREALTGVLHTEAPVEFNENPQLLAGLRITVGSGSLGLNLEDELQGFARLTDADG